ncbi:hypothetical protein NLU13_1556 [Sarocladium strictum]|uniref:Mediator of RNA polymerase II transcription subunit 11 n=1 Tax=Sarocladium strictum TaxID=5046 RepID=A0AA39LCC3_SARSR|nr:hypothetical protein NLU13_1556 [Sarocladium strictum]
MSSSDNDISMDEVGPHDQGQSDFKPFTVQENIQQLNAIDASIVKLMEHTSTSLNALTTSLDNASIGSPKPSVDPAAQKEAYRAATDSFLTTLHSIDVRMKRHILALEEAGVVDLAPKKKTDINEKPPPTLKPDGVGSVGGMDVGWLNSRSSKVERDMERELWDKTRNFLERDGDKLRHE